MRIIIIKMNSNNNKYNNNYNNNINNNNNNNNNNNKNNFIFSYTRLQNMSNMMDIHFDFEDEKEINNQDLEEEENDNMLLNDLTDYKKETINN